MKALIFWALLCGAMFGIATRMSLPANVLDIRKVFVQLDEGEEICAA